MTSQREFKALVRERMQKTGERYTAARAHLLHNIPPDSRSRRDYSGLLASYRTFGGVQAGTGALTNVLRHAGVRMTPGGDPLTEAFVNGLCGGPGFLYATFEYKGWPPLLTLALQSRSMPDVYIAQGVAWSGVRATVRETTSAALARKTLDDVLDAGHAALCVTDHASLPWAGLPSEFRGGAPHVIAVAGKDGEGYWVDDRMTRPIRVDADTLSRARAAYRHAKNRLIVVEASDTPFDGGRAVRDAIRDTASSYTTPAVPKSFWSNCGFAGLDKWRRLLVDKKDKKGWPSLFAEGPRACAGLQRAYECIDAQSAPGAGRAYYAEFLDEAAALTTSPALSSAAATYREAATLWQQLARLVADCPDAAVRKACEITDRRLELGDSAGDSVSQDVRDLWNRRQALAADCRLTAEQATRLYSAMADIVEAIAATERAAVRALVEIDKSKKR
jgi:hypothetical protein